MRGRVGHACAAAERPPTREMREVKLHSNIFDQFRHVLAFGQFRHVVAVWRARRVVTYVMCVEHHLL